MTILQSHLLYLIELIIFSVIAFQIFFFVNKIHMFKLCFIYKHGLYTNLPKCCNYYAPNGKNSEAKLLESQEILYILRKKGSNCQREAVVTSQGSLHCWPTLGFRPSRDLLHPYLFLLLNFQPASFFSAYSTEVGKEAGR